MTNEIDESYEPSDWTPRERCPCCDYISLPERGRGLLCPVCLWTDDGKDFDQLDDSSESNDMTLREGRTNFKRIGAYDDGFGDSVSREEERKQYEHRPRECEPFVPNPLERCPCCDYHTLTERGYYSICPVCFWEDDGKDTYRLDDQSCANHGLTLREGRANFKRFGACEEAMVKHVLTAEKRKRFEHRPRNVE